MTYERIYLIDGREDVYLDVYVADKTPYFLRKALLVIPGGGYSCVCADKEGEPVALSFMNHGFNCFVLNYSVGGKDTFPAQLIEASLAMKHIKDRSDLYGIDPTKIFTVGFSAGGHLAGSLGLLWHLPEVYEAIDMPYGYNKPAGMMLVYPVISGIEEFSHKSSHCYLWGENPPTDDKLIRTSLERHVDEKSVPLFVMHTSNDQIVDVRNSLELGAAYRRARLTFEMHIFPDSPHGIALANKMTWKGKPIMDNPHIAQWVELAAQWSDSIE
ncbi:MAG: alpha/beta hydrolase [Clostridia bacterium]|nr:alpha/beta hydrolase [Clostridia bacterium]